jgi:hypothetical protein
MRGFGYGQQIGVSVPLASSARDLILAPFRVRLSSDGALQKTGGRQKGTPNNASVEKQLCTALGLRSGLIACLLPLARTRNEPLPVGLMVTDEQFTAAIAAAPYCTRGLPQRHSGGAGRF